MHRPLTLALASLLLGRLAGPADAQEGDRGSVFEVRDVVRQLAFDPARYFPSPYIDDRSVVRIVYTGDDYAWPVYAIAVAEGCIDDETARTNDCAVRLRARMVRAPAPPELVRPRQRGSYLVSRIAERRAESAEAIRVILDEVGLEWLEADMRACPEALSVLHRADDAVWVPEAVARPTAGDELSDLVLHADIVRVEFQQYARRSTYSGWIADGSPGAWAVELAEALEPCWRAAQIPAPWMRPD